MYFITGDPNTCEVFNGTTTLSTTTSSTSTPPLTTSTEITTSQTLPPTCIDGNLNDRVCELEKQNTELKEIIEEILKEKEVMRENFDSQIETIVRENAEQKSLVSAAFEDMQKQIYELASRPCSCR